MVWLAAVLALGALGGVLLLRWGTRWGTTPGERVCPMPGDGYLDGGPRTRAVMTRAVSIDAPPQRVWPWIAQLGRGAGFYSIDGLDNGRKGSARHVVSWIPEPRSGDSTAIGYLRHVDAGHAIAWWVDGVSFAGATCRLVSAYELHAEGEGTRLVSRMSADGTGRTAAIAMLVFRVIDSIMARRQLLGIRERVEQPDAVRIRSSEAETGARDQYQLYEVIYADGAQAGVAGKESAARWRRSAIDDGVLPSAG